MENDKTTVEVSKTLLESLKRYKTYMHFHSLDETVEDLLFNRLGDWFERVQKMPKEKASETLYTTFKWLEEQLTIMMKNPKRLAKHLEAEAELKTESV